MTMHKRDQGEKDWLVWPKAVLFDLDGTLIDSVPDLATATNRLLAAHGLPPLGMNDVRSMIGHGVAKLVERAFASRGTRLTPLMLERRTDEMMAFYGQCLTDQTRLNIGAAEAIASLRRMSVRIAVVTNKPEAFAKAILGHFDLLQQVDVVVGGDTGPARKPEPEMLVFAVNVLDLKVEDAVMVGDSRADMDAARAAGMASIAVEGGYTSESATSLGADANIPDLGKMLDGLSLLPQFHC
jgi:phosphoglycolate phosphatase